MRLKKLIPAFVRGLLFTLILSLLQLVPVSTFAQLTKLLDFGATPNGHLPYSSLISDGTFLYGMTFDGGSSNLGTIYKIKPDGTGFTKLLDFDGANGSSPSGSLLFDGTFLYGMTLTGGAGGHGVIFKIMPDGTSFTKLLDFVYGSHGAFPRGSLISDGTFLYGMTSQGGASFYGTVFKIKSDGTGFAKLLDFDATNNGASPYGSLFSDGTFLYGMTTQGGASFFGTAFKIKPDGTGYAKLLDFNGTNGGSPYGSFISDGTFLYGMTLSGSGAANFGTLFKIKPDATGFVNLLYFDNLTRGAHPKGSLISDGTFLYGMTTDYGANGRGTIFKVMPDGTGFVKLLDGDVGTNGPSSEGTLLMIGATLYGVKSGGGSGLAPFLPGTVFKINSNGTGYTKLFSFEVAGTKPAGSLVSDGTFLYGATNAGGLYDYGTIFKIKPDGTGFVKLLDFDDVTNGLRPNGSLIFDGTFLYGMTNQGGINAEGTIFKIKTDGTGYVKLLDFSNTTSGSTPYGSLISDGTFLYGTTTHGGTEGYGTIFKIMPNGTGYVKLHDLDYMDGSYPFGCLVSDGTFLYGTTKQGGSIGAGTIFKIKTDGTAFAKLIEFDDAISGSNPEGSLISDGTFLYGTTSGGGSNSKGTIFKIMPDGTGYAKLLDFDGDNNGSSPKSALVSAGTFLYGVASEGGIMELGTLFKIKADGTGYVKLMNFNDGAYPYGALITDGSFLYGMTQIGGANAFGTLFKSSLSDYVSITNFIPDEGVIGTTIHINGTGFDPIPANNIVKFNNTTAIVTSSTGTTLTAVVPTGATSGPITVTAGTTDAGATDFNVTTEAVMINGTVQNCNVQFSEPNTSDYDDIIETFLPINPADKIKVSFSSFDVSDVLYVYDGPTPASPLIATLDGDELPDDIVATSPGGELTFLWRWQDASSHWEATISCQAPEVPIPSISISTTPLTTQIGGKITLDLIPLIGTANSKLDLTSLQVVIPPSSGAIASIDAAGVLTIDYNGRNFSGIEQLSIRACNTDGNCTTQTFNIEVAGELIVYNGVSPNGANPAFIIQHINILPDTKDNTVYIFDRWENQVWHGTNYDNSSVVFTGVSDGGNDLPSGVYYYKIDFTSGRKKLTGFLSLRRQ